VDPVGGHRASDAEREAVADRLRTAAGDGRLDPDELEERLAAAYSARTTGELVPLTADLPAAPRPEEPAPRWRDSDALRTKIASFLTTNLVCWAIWLATGANSSVWPKWVTLLTALALAVTLIRTALGVEEEASEGEHGSEAQTRAAARHERARDRHDRRRDRRGF
jgi:hypothetical protein